MEIIPPEIDRTLTARQVADFYLLTTNKYSTVLRLIREGKLTAQKVGREYRIPVSEIKDYNRKYLMKRRAAWRK